MRFSPLFALLAMVICFLAVSVQAAAPPSATSLQLNNGLATRSQFTVDDGGNSYFIDDNLSIVVMNTAGARFTGCVSPTNYNVLTSNAGSNPVALQIVTNAQFPTVPSTRTLVAQFCPSVGQCRFYALPLNPSAALNSCPFNTETAAVVLGNGCNFANGFSLSPFVIDSRGFLVYSCGATTTLFRTNALTARGVGATTQLITGAPSTTPVNAALSRSVVRDMTVDPQDNVWLVAGNSVFVATNDFLRLDFPHNICGNCGAAASSWTFGLIQQEPNGITVDASGTVYISFGRDALAGKIWSFNTANLYSNPQPAPTAWAYFNQAFGTTPAAFFEYLVSNGNVASPAAGGSLFYDAYTGRMLVNAYDRFWSIPLIALTFDKAGGSTGYTATGTTCTLNTAGCFPVLTATSGVSSTFNVRIYTATIPQSLSFNVQLSSSVSGATVAPTGTNVGAVSGTAAGGATSFVRDFSVTLTSQTTYPVTLGLTFSGTVPTTYDPSWLFTGAGSSKSVFVQGSIAFAASTIVNRNPAISTGLPNSNTGAFSSNPALAGTVSRYTLVASPAVPAATACTTPTLSLSTTAPGATFTPNSLTFDRISNSVSVAYRVGTSTTAQVWNGVFSCSTMVGQARVPTHILLDTVSVTPSPAITFQQFQSLTSGPSTVIFAAYPAPSGAFSFNPTFSLGSATVSSTGITTTNAGAYSSATLSLNSGNGCFPNGGTCADVNAAPSFTPDNTQVPAGTQVVLRATASGTAGFLDAFVNYWYINENLSPTQIRAGLTTITVATLTPALSGTITFDSSITNPNIQVVAPGKIIGPYRLAISTAGLSAVQFDDNLRTAPGRFLVFATLPATFPTDAQFTASGVNTLTNVQVGNGYYVYYRAADSGAQLGRLPGVVNDALHPVGSFSVIIPSNVFLSFTAPTLANAYPNIQILGLVSYTFTSIQGLATTNNYVWAGRTSTTQNRVVVDVGFPVQTATTVTVTVSVMDILNGAVTANVYNADASRNIAARLTASELIATAFGATATTVQTTQTVTLTIPVGSRSSSFWVAGGLPTGLANLRFSSTVSPSPANFQILDNFAFMIGQVYVDSVPTSFQMGVPAYMRVKVDPVPTVTETISISDNLPTVGAVALRGAFRFCSTQASSCTSAINVVNNVAQLPLVNVVSTGAGANVAADGFSFIHYVPPTNAAALGQVPRFTFTTAGQLVYAFAVNSAITAPITATQTSQAAVGAVAANYLLNVAGFSAIQGSIAATFLNYEAAMGAQSTVGTPGVNADGTLNAARQYTYPIGNGVSDPALPTPVILDANSRVVGAANEVLAGVKYAVMFTLYPPPTGPVSFSLSYVDSTNAAASNGHTFEYNNLVGTTTSRFATLPAYSATAATTASVTDAQLTSSGLLDGIRTLTATTTTVACPADSANANGQCAVALVFWTPGRTASASGALQVSITSGAGSTYVNNQRIPFAVRRWCGLSTDLRQVLSPAQYGVPQQLNVVCPAGISSAAFSNTNPTQVTSFQVLEKNSGLLVHPFRTIFPNYQFAINTTIINNFASNVVPVPQTGLPDAVTGVYQYTQFVATLNDQAANMYPGTTHYNGASYVEFDLTSAFKTASGADFMVTRARRAVAGTYAFSLSTTAQQNMVQVSAQFPFGQTATVAPTPLLPTSLSSTSTSFGVLKFLPTVNVAANTAFTFSDGLAFNAGQLVDQFTVNVANANVGGGIAGATVSYTSTSAVDTFPFSYALNSAPLVSTNFRVCAAVTPVATGGNPAQAIPNRGCSATGVSTLSLLDVSAPANSPAVEFLPYPTVSNGVLGSATAALTANAFSVPIAVTMAFNNVPANPLMVGHSYTFELRTATALSSPVLNGLTVNLVDECGTINVNNVVTGVAALGTFSSRQLVFKAGDVTKTFTYTPSRICATAGTATNKVYIRAVIDTASTDAQIFVAPVPLAYDSFGTVHVTGIQARYPAGAAGPQITVRTTPLIGTPALATGAVYNGATTDLKVTVNDRANNGAGNSQGGTFLTNNVLAYTATSSAPKSLVYVAPTSDYLRANNLVNTQNGITVVLSGADAALYRVAPVTGTIYNSLASTAVASATNALVFNSFVVADSFSSSVTAFGLNPSPSIQGVYFNFVSGASLSGSTATTISSVPDTASSFVGNSAVAPGAGANVLNFNIPFVPGVHFGYFASVPFAQSAVVVNVESSANTIFVNNNGWPNAQNGNTNYGGYVLPNALSGYVTPVFFLTPGLNTFLVAAPTVFAAANGNAASADSFTVDVAQSAPAGLFSRADGDGIVYRFTIARDTITSLAFYVAPANAANAAAAGVQSVAWASGLSRLAVTPQFATGASSLFTYGSAHEYNVNVDFAVQNVAMTATFFGTLKVQSSSNFNELGQNLVTLPNNQLVTFPLTTPTNLAGAHSATTVLTLVGGGLGPITINVHRAPKSLFVFGAGLVDTAMGPCILRTATSFQINVFPNARPSTPAGSALSISGSYTLRGVTTPVQMPAVTNSGTTWESTQGDFATLGRIMVQPVAFTAAQLPVNVNIQATYGSAASEFTGLMNYQLDLCPAA